MRVKNSFVFFHTDENKVRGAGIRYGGNSKMKLESAFFRRVLSSKFAINMPSSAEMIYIKNMRKTFPFEKNAPPITANTGSFALHAINGVVSTVLIFSFLLLRFCAVIIAVAVQPNPIRNVKTLLPDSPTLLKIPSIR